MAVVCVTYFCIWFLLQDNPGEIEIDWDVIDRRLLELDGKIVTSLKRKKRNRLVESFLGFLKASPGSPTFCHTLQMISVGF